jgi:hypothetical protein
MGFFVLQIFSTIGDLTTGCIGVNSLAVPPAGPQRSTMVERQGASVLTPFH